MRINLRRRPRPARRAARGVPSPPGPISAGAHLLGRPLFSASLALVASLAGCAYYSTSATGGGTSFRSIAVPLFKNETLEHGLEETVTRTVADAFIEDNNLDVVAETEAQSILWGTIADYRRIPFTFNAQNVVIEYKLEIVARVEYEDRENNKTVWSDNDLRAWATYAAEGTSGGSEETVASEDEAVEVAVDKLARELVAKTVGGW